MTQIQTPEANLTVALVLSNTANLQKKTEPLPSHNLIGCLTETKSGLQV